MENKSLPVVINNICLYDAVLNWNFMVSVVSSHCDMAHMAKLYETLPSDLGTYSCYFVSTLAIDPLDKLAYVQCQL